MSPTVVDWLCDLSDPPAGLSPRVYLPTSPMAEPSLVQAASPQVLQWTLMNRETCTFTPSHPLCHATIQEWFVVSNQRQGSYSTVLHACAWSISKHAGKQHLLGTGSAKNLLGTQDVPPDSCVVQQPMKNMPTIASSLLVGVSPHVPLFQDRHVQGDGIGDNQTSKMGIVP